MQCKNTYLNYKIFEKLNKYSSLYVYINILMWTIFGLMKNDYYNFVDNAIVGSHESVVPCG